jgi:hypothetical protein
MGKITKAMTGCVTGAAAGGLLGGCIGWVAGHLDTGSFMILMPHGPPFWGLAGAVLGVFFGAVAGIVFNLFRRAVSKDPESEMGP